MSEKSESDGAYINAVRDKYHDMAVQRQKELEMMDQLEYLLK